ncbi:hypothetical protein MMC25_003491 [Agyrium rufum]|nr:hypothetical protein [Agyrium rufum]
MTFSNSQSQPAIPTYRVMDWDGIIVDKAGAPSDVSIEEIVKWYTDMLTVNIMDLIMYDAQRQGRISFYMVSQGEEGIAVGSAAALDPEDVVFSQYREAGVFQHRGFTIDDFMNQLFATDLDPGKGRNMPVHYGSGKLNHYTISSCLATQLPQAAGSAYALKLQSLQNPNIAPRVAACYFGEGAASEGDFHAALNFAATRSCPVIFVCRNNGYAISTPTLEQYRGDGIASRGVGYGVDTVRVDGNDIFAVRRVMKEARRRALEGDCKPVLIEAMSYRGSHHSTSDDSFAYRARVEVEDWKRRDTPIARLRKWMEGAGCWDEAKEKEARSRIRKEVLDGVKRAEGRKRAPLREMWKDVYETVTEEQKAQMEELRGLVQRYPDEYDVSEYQEGLEGLKLKEGQ